jgi:hypothetical protein
MADDDNPSHGERARLIYRQEGFSAEHQAALDAKLRRKLALPAWVPPSLQAGTYPHRMPPCWVQHP